jgi:hypothetical protein
MRYLILSDIHSNREALSAVVSFVKRKRWDKAVFLGDLVGYGANPNQTVDMVRSLRPLAAIRGNHDKVCSGSRTASCSTGMALQAAMWTRKRLTKSNLEWLKALPQGPAVVDVRRSRSATAPRSTEDAYIFGELEALNVFRHYGLSALLLRALALPRHLRALALTPSRPC